MIFYYQNKRSNKSVFFGSYVKSSPRVKVAPFQGSLYFFIERCDYMDSRKRIYDFIVEYIGRCGYSPTVREICTGVNLKSTSTVHHHLLVLVDNGLIRMGCNKVRSIEVLTPYYL